MKRRRRRRSSARRRHPRGDRDPVLREKPCSRRQSPGEFDRPGDRPEFRGGRTNTVTCANGSTATSSFYDQLCPACATNYAKRTETASSRVGWRSHGQASRSGTRRGSSCCGRARVDRHHALPRDAADRYAQEADFEGGATGSRSGSTCHPRRQELHLESTATGSTSSSTTPAGQFVGRPGSTAMLEGEREAERWAEVRAAGILRGVRRTQMLPPAIRVGAPKRPLRGPSRPGSAAGRPARAQLMAVAARRVSSVRLLGRNSSTQSLRSSSTPAETAGTSTGPRQARR
jgi:hypothetical protein